MHSERRRARRTPATRTWPDRPGSPRNISIHIIIIIIIIIIATIVIIVIITLTIIVIVVIIIIIITTIIIILLSLLLLVRTQARVPTPRSGRAARCASWRACCSAAGTAAAPPPPGRGGSPPRPAEPGVRRSGFPLTRTGPVPSERPRLFFDARCRGSQGPRSRIPTVLFFLSDRTEAVGTTPFLFQALRMGSIPLERQEARSRSPGPAGGGHGGLCVAPPKLVGFPEGSTIVLWSASKLLGAGGPYSGLRTSFGGSSLARQRNNNKPITYN